ncbi:ABC transporter permease [Methylosoma difficile]
MSKQADYSGQLPVLVIEQQANGERHAVLSGAWHLNGIAQAPKLRAALKQLGKNRCQNWDLRAIDSLDGATALILWQAWGKQWPANMQISPEHRQLFVRWQTQSLPIMPTPKGSFSAWGCVLAGFWDQLLSLLVLLGQLVLDIGYLLLHPKETPWGEISTTIYDAGVRALGITALVGFLIGIVLSYLSALQLKMFGAEIYIINILGMSIIRELGPLLAAILVAGRSGSAMTAQIGIMRVTEELDALSAMGIAHSLRLVLPKVVALSAALPLLSVWTSAAALLGGMVAAFSTLDIGSQLFVLKLPEVVPVVNIVIGFGKSVVFGLMIALVACHFGFRIKPNTESLGLETTNSVVASITSVIMIDAVFAILLMHVGVP